MGKKLTFFFLALFLSSHANATILKNSLFNNLQYKLKINISEIINDKNINNKNAENCQFFNYVDYQKIFDNPRSRLIILTNLNACSIKIWEQKAQAGSAFAMVILGEALAFGFGDYQPDENKAIEWLEKAANLNFPGAQNELLFLQFKKAHQSMFANAANIIRKAEFDFDNNILTDNFEPAQELIDMADAGFVDANLLLAKMYFTGHGIKSDLTQALFYYQKAAELGSGFADQQLSLFFAQGIGTQVDQQSAFIHLIRAANRGIVKSQIDLGLLYWEGKLLPFDPIEGTKWLFIARIKDNTSAENIINIIFKKNPDILTQNQLAEIQDSAKIWIANHKYSD